MPSRPRNPTEEVDNPVDELALMYTAWARPPRGALWSREVGYVKRTREESIAMGNHRGFARKGGK